MAPRSAPPAALMDELVEETLLRIPPDDPARLLRAALVCKRWCRIVSDPGFRRRFREFHRTPPMLGILFSRLPWSPYTFNTYFVSTSSFRPSPARLYYKTVDARHGRVLLHDVSWSNEREHCDDSFVVWVPIAGGERLRLPSVPRYRYQETNFPLGTWNAAVLCASADDACDHLECHCHSGPFLVVFVASGRRWGRSGICALVYSSEAAAWSQKIYAPRLDEEMQLAPSALAGNSVFFMCRRSVLKFDMATREMSLIDLPQQSFGRPILRATEDGGLGLATMCSGELYLWSMEIGPDEDVGWAQSNAINLTELLPAEPVIPDKPLCSPFLTGSAHGLDILLVCTSMGIFTIHLKLVRVTKVCKDCLNKFIFPYMSFYTPGTRHWERPPLPSDQEQAPQVSDEHKILHYAALSVKVKRDHGSSY